MSKIVVVERVQQQSLIIDDDEVEEGQTVLDVAKLFSEFENDWVTQTVDVISVSEIGE